MLVCPIPGTHVGTCSPALGPAVLRYGFVGVWRAKCPIYQASTRECSPLLQSCARAMMWWVPTSGYAKVWLSSLALGTRLASGLSRARQKYVFVPYRELAYVTRPHEWKIIVAQWGKNLNRVKNDLSLEWEWCIHVQLVWILTTKQKCFVESGEKNKGLICLLLCLKYYSF